jgi:4-amino-4-deoxy-L-arabinose transferase-like glycosyltransferase
LPLPAPAKIRRGPSICSTASLCAGFKSSSILFITSYIIRYDAPKKIASCAGFIWKWTHGIRVDNTISIGYTCNKIGIKHNRRSAAAHQLIIVSTVVLLLAPFAGRAFNIDEPLFLWTAQQIVSHPADPYGYNINWYGTVMPASDIIKNPPTASYYIAAVSALVGWGEVALHLAFLLPAIAAALGIYSLARRLSAHPLIAVFAGVLTPAFLVSSLTVMCDVMMLAFWVWAVVFWIKGLDRDEGRYYALSALLIGFAALTKYYGMALIPLLFIYSVLSRKKPGLWMVYFLIPVVMLAGYQYATALAYGRGLLLDAADYASSTRWKHGIDILPKALIGLSFTGGCAAVIFFFAPMLLSRKAFLFWLAFLASEMVLLPLLTIIGVTPLWNEGGGILWGIVFQLSLFIAGGLGIVFLAAADFKRNRDADSALLLLWVLATFVFTAFVNWTANGRSVLPMVPAIAILIARNLKAHPRLTGRWAACMLIPAAALSVMVMWSDYSLANSARTAAREIHGIYGHSPVWFEGHWGFQYYMQALGGKPVEKVKTRKLEARIVVIPVSNTNVTILPSQFMPFDIVKVNASGLPNIMNKPAGAGFYASLWGSLPYSFNGNAEQLYPIYLFQ